MTTLKADSTNVAFDRAKYTESNSRVPSYSRLHPVIPRLYVPPWKNDMSNRRQIIKNAVLGGVPVFEHDDNLFLEKREQLYYNVENPHRVDGKYTFPDRACLLHPDFPHQTSRYQSGLMCRWDKSVV